MNEFIEQFLIEARELVEQATDDLLALERAPDDRARLDSAFRAFHTLKGAAGIIEFEAMARALHAAEDGLSAVRAGGQSLTAALVGDALSVLDQVVQWLDAVEVAGEAPKDADAAADALAARFANAAPASIRLSPPALPSGWLDDLRARHAEVLPEARAAFVYHPPENCFFDGEDPLARIRDLPGLLALTLIPNGTPGALDALDPFICRLAFAALSSQPPEAIAAALGDRHLTLVPLAAEAGGLDAIARDILQAQLRMLRLKPEEAITGRASSAARTAASVLTQQGQEAAAQAVQAALESGGAASLIDVLKAVLEGRFTPPSPQAETPPTPADAPEPAVRSVRVEVERIDALVRLTDEFTVLKSGVEHLVSLAADGRDGAKLAELLKTRHLQLERLVGELQQAVLNMRVLPVRQVFQRFPRLLRDLATTLGKPVRLLMEGEDTEADKAVVESLFEPLLHVIRNAVDHGLETEERRTVAGKPPVGLITLRAFRKGEEVVVEIEDDGAGVDVELVRAIAAERGLTDAATLAAMSQEEVVDLVFAPGFSTSATVTSLSGRGVGMDAVRAAIGRLGGRVSLQSRRGEGSTVRFTVPFTIMLTQVMTVEAGGQAFGLPADTVVETLRLPRQSITAVGAAFAFVFRGRTAPLIRLGEVLGADEGGPGGPQALVVVVKVGEQLVGLEVDRVLNRAEVMLKPMDGLLSGMAGIAGTTLMGDGGVLVVLDVGALIT